MSDKTVDRRRQARSPTRQAAAEAEASQETPGSSAGGTGSPRQLAQRAQIDQLRGAMPAAGAATLQLQRNKAGLASAKADRRAERQRRGDRGRQEARRQEPQDFDPGRIGHAPTGEVGVMLTLLMLLGQINGAGAQPLTARAPRSLARHAPDHLPDHQPEAQRNSTALAPQRPGSLALPQSSPLLTSPARLGMPSMGLLPLDRPTTETHRPTNSTALTTRAQPRPPERPLIEGQRTMTSTAILPTPRRPSDDMCALNETGMATQSDKVAYGKLAHVRCDPLVEALCGEARSNPIYNGTLSEVDQVCKDVQITDPVNKPGACVFNAKGDGAGKLSCKALDSYDDTKIGHELEHAVDSCRMQQGGGSLGRNYWGVVSEIHAHTVQAAIAKNNQEKGLKVESRDLSLMKDFDAGCIMPSSAAKLDNVDAGMWAIVHSYHKLYVQTDLSLPDLLAMYGKEMAKAHARYTDMTQSSSYISAKDPRYKAIK
ncbi:hypothetical protein [Roseateles cavernae]|uniref:hypothetical protein n=1 Tax=Roseateles cavernae TaxID=3153578 RepID=UPI0032E41D87